MHIVEEDKYKVSCHVSRSDLRAYGITADDIINRTPLGNLFIKKAAQLAKESTDYDWPGCAFSMQIEMYTNDFVLVFSEQIDDYIYNLRQTMLAMPKEQADMLEKMIVMISMADEDEARMMIRNFENNVREV